MNFVPMSCDCIDFPGRSGECPKNQNYRYAKWRTFHPGPRFLVVMFNPAGNPPERDGPTTKTLINLAGNAKYQGEYYGGLLIANLFVYKSPRKDSAIKLLREKGLLESSGGANNSRHLDLMAGQSSGKVLLAWGDLEIDMQPYATAVKKRLSDLGREFVCLGITDDNNPRHPSDWKAAKRFEPFRGD